MSETKISVPQELRQAADKLTAEPHCGGVYSDCACDYAEQLAGLFRDLAAKVEADPDYPVSLTAVDMARRINRAEVPA